jgi:hypothetical protein
LRQRNEPTNLRICVLLRSNELVVKGLTGRTGLISYQYVLTTAFVAEGFARYATLKLNATVVTGACALHAGLRKYRNYKVL